jgi:aldehyde decarbonylase
LSYQLIYIYIYIYIVVLINIYGFLDQYLVLAPGVIHSAYSFVTKDESERNLSNLLIFPFLLWRMLHNQIWISLSRYWTAKGNNSIVDKGLEFEQVDRESNWCV